MTITCGIDWAGSHHDVALVDGTGKLVAKRRISDDAEGLRRLLDLLTEAGDTAGDPIPVPVEAARGLLISCLRATGRAVYSINPMAVACYRERHRVSCSPSRGQRCTERSPAAEPARRSDPALCTSGQLRESAGNGRCTSASVRRMWASAIASAWSDFARATRWRSR